MAYIGEATGGEISIHALREEGDFLCLLGSSTLINFYPRPPRGGRPGRRNVRRLVGVFLSTPSARRATCTVPLAVSPAGYFYPRPPRGGRRAHQLYLCSSYPISIHALREEGDRSGDNMDVNESEFLSTPSARRATKILDAVCRVDGISIHALREEGDIRPASWPCGMRRFLSTPSARRATLMS